MKALYCSHPECGVPKALAARMPTSSRSGHLRTAKSVAHQISRKYSSDRAAMNRSIAGRRMIEVPSKAVQGCEYKVRPESLVISRMATIDKKG